MPMRNGYDEIKDMLRPAYDGDVALATPGCPRAGGRTSFDQLATGLRERGLRRVIELGAGTGQLAQHLQGQGFEVLATMYSDEAFHALEFTAFDTLRSEVLDVVSDGASDLRPRVKLLEAA